MDRAERARAVHGLAHVIGNVDRQQQRPAHVLVVVRRLGGVEGDAGLGRVVVHDIRPLGLVGTAGLALLQRRFEAVRRGTDEVGLVRQLRQDLGAFVGEVLEDDVLGLGLAKHDAGRALVPVRTLFPDRPEAGGVKAVQLVGAGADKRVELEGDRVVHLFPDVLGHDPGAPQRSRNLVWKREFGLFSSKATVWSSGAETDLTLSTKKLLSLKPSFFISVSTVKTTSAAVNGSPSDQVTPWRSGIVKAVKSALYLGSPSARPLMILPVAKSTDHSGSFARFCMPRSRHFQPTQFVEVAGRAHAAGQDVGDQRLVAGQVAQARRRLLFRRGRSACGRLLGSGCRSRRGRTRRKEHAGYDKQPQNHHQFALHSLLLFTLSGFTGTGGCLNCAKTLVLAAGTTGVRPAVSALCIQAGRALARQSA